MIMEDSKMSKIEYDLKAMMYSVYGIRISENNLSSNPDYHPIMRADPCVSSNTPRLVQVESWVTPVRFSREGGGQRDGCTNPDTWISPYANRMGKQAFQAHFGGQIYQ